MAGPGVPSCPLVLGVDGGGTGTTCHAHILDPNGGGRTLATGVGEGGSANANSVFSGVTTNPDGTRAKLSPGDILGGGLGQGAADAADTVSKYLIERAEQYQPVVEMPTGIDVEIVFLDGVYVRNSQ